MNVYDELRELAASVFSIPAGDLTLAFRANSVRVLHEYHPARSSEELAQRGLAPGDDPVAALAGALTAKANERVLEATERRTRATEQLAQEESRLQTATERLARLQELAGQPRS